MSAETRYTFLHQYPFDNIDSLMRRQVLNTLLKIATEQKDYKAQVVIQYQTFRQRANFQLKQKERKELLLAMIALSKKHHFKVEEIVAQHYLNFVLQENKEISFEAMFIRVQKMYNQFEEVGFEKFKQYEIERLLRHLGKFMFALDDFDKALEYLLQAEKFMKVPTEWNLSYVLHLNLIQTIYQKQENYAQTIQYAQKILDFIQKVKQKDRNNLNLIKIWQGLANVDIASTLILQQKIQESEVYARKAYQFVKIDQPTDIELIAEYDVLQVLINIQLKLHHIKEAEQLWQRTIEIKQRLPEHPKEDYFKHIAFYELSSKLYELKGDFQHAILHANLAKTLKDSLQKRNDARKFQKMQQRLDIEKYSKKLRLIEQEKQIQTWLFYSVFLLLVGTSLLVFGNYRRIARKRANVLNTLQEKEQLLDSLQTELVQKNTQQDQSEALTQLYQSTILTNDDWIAFRALFEKVYPNYINEQKALYPTLTPAELRFLVLEKLNLDVNEMANMLGISPNSVHKTQQRLRKKIT